MLDIIFYCFICILALYGLISLIISITGTIYNRACEENDSIRFVIVVKNQQETIEGIIKNIIAGNLLGKLMSDKKLTVVDLNSSDETLKILQKLKSDYEWLEILSEDEKEKIFIGFYE